MKCPKSRVGLLGLIKKNKCHVSLCETWVLTKHWACEIPVGKTPTPGISSPDDTLDPLAQEATKGVEVGELGVTEQTSRFYLPDLLNKIQTVEYEDAHDPDGRAQIFWKDTNKYKPDEILVRVESENSIVLVSLDYMESLYSLCKATNVQIACNDHEPVILRHGESIKAVIGTLVTESLWDRYLV